MKFLWMMSLVFISESVLAVDLSSDFLKYRRTTNDLMRLIALGSDSREIVAKAKSLMDIAKPIVVEFKKSVPDCASYLEATLQAADAMQALSFDAIETQYHRGDKLPTAPRGCYNAKDLIVHPATVAVLARKDLSSASKEQMRHEMTEVIQHLEEVKKQLQSSRAKTS